jgi:hypothetical protein
MKTCTIKPLLCWCICLFISNAVAGGWWLVVGVQAQPPKATEPLPMENRPPTTDHRLPCLSSEPDCLRTLGDVAVTNNLEICTLDQAIQLAKKKQWTTWLNADGLNPIAMGLRIARNVAGGGDRAALKLDIANLERRRAEVETNLRQSITQAVSDYEAAERRVRLARAKLAAHEAKLKLLEATYKLGEGETETMLTLWQQREELQGQIVNAEADAKAIVLQLQTHIAAAKSDDKAFPKP